MSRGGRGGGRTGRFNPQIMGGLTAADIQYESQHEPLYKTMEIPDSAYPSEHEDKVAKRYQEMVFDLQKSAFYIDVQRDTKKDIETYTDKLLATENHKRPTLYDMNKARAFDRKLIPPALYESVFEKKRRKLEANGEAKKVQVDKLLNADEEDNDESGSENEVSDEEAENLEAEVSEESENDYEENYFDNGEDDAFEDALGAAGGGDDEGGMFE